MSKPIKTTVKIESVGAGGDGFATFDGGAAYFPFTVAGDVAEVRLQKKGVNNWQGQVIKLVEESPNRAEPMCKHFGTCGGCSLQHLKPNYYNQWIKGRVQTALSHHAIEEVELLEPEVSPTNSRRRLNLKAFHNGRSVVLGFNKRKSHQIVNLEMCPVAKSEMVELFPAIRELLGKLLTSRQGGDVEMMYLDGRLGLQISLPKDPSLEGREALATFAQKHGLATLSINIDGFSELVAESSPFSYGFNTDIPVAVPVSAFVQATDEGEKALQQEVLRAISEFDGHIETVVDLFSGLGTFSLPLAKGYKTLAVEGELKLINALKAGAQQKALNSFDIDHRDLFRRPLTVDELNNFNAIVFDPPRAGAQAQVEQIAKSNVALVVGVSCNPNTFARDAKTLINGGYKLKTIKPVDQFLWSHHVELVGVFEKLT